MAEIGDLSTTDANNTGTAANAVGAPHRAGDVLVGRTGSPGAGQGDPSGEPGEPDE